MSDFIGEKKWSSVRLLEQHELARGGLNGNMNEQAKSLVNRSEFLKDKLNIYVTPEEHGASGNGIDDDYESLVKAHNALLPGQILKGSGIYAVSQKFVFTKRHVGIEIDGFIVPHGDFSDFVFRFDYDWTAGAVNQERGDIAGIIDIRALNVDCKYQSRGIDFYRIDCSTLDKVFVYRGYGTALTFNRFRESTIQAPKVIGCERRLRFPTPNFYNDSQAYEVGQRVRIGYSNYSSVVSYSRYDNVIFDGNRYESLVSNNIGNSPSVSFASWKRMPFIDYECMIAHTNKNPEIGYNTNNSDSSQRYWKRIYQDEAVCEIVDDGNPNIDRQNQVIINDVDFRDWNNLCGVRIDNVKSSAPPTHIKLQNAHIHALQPSVIASYAAAGKAGEIVPEDIPEMQRVIEIQRGQNITVFGNLRLPNSKDSFIAIIGDGSNKAPTSVHIGGVASGSGDNQMGVYVGNNALVGRSDLDLRYILDGSNTLNLYDPFGFFSLQRNTPIKVTLPNYMGNAPVAYSAEVGFGYGQSWGFQAKKTGDSHPRLGLRMDQTRSNLVFGSGSSPGDTLLFRDGVGVLRIGDDNQLRMPMTWQYPMIANGYHLWVTSDGIFRIKQGKPNNDTDGNIIGTQI